MRVLTIRQPWAWLIVNGYKDVENRSKPTKYRGPLIIQSSALSPPRNFERAMRFAEKRGVLVPSDLKYGGVVGMSNLVDCVTESDSQWFEGPFGYVMRNARELPFVPLKGQLAMFRPPYWLLDKLFR